MARAGNRKSLSKISSLACAHHEDTPLCSSFLVSEPVPWTSSKQQLLLYPKHCSIFYNITTAAVQQPKDSFPLKLGDNFKWILPLAE